MTLPRKEIEAGFANEVARFGDLVRSVSPEDLEKPTRCEAWTVGDVAAHVIGTLADITAGRLEGLGTPEVTQRAVDERRGHSPDELADELQQVSKLGIDLLASFDDAAWDGPAPPGVPGTLGAGVEALWYDAYLHADDIRTAIGRPSEPGEGIKASVEHVKDNLAANGWGPATINLTGFGTFDIGGSGGKEITADPFEFVLVGTGRKDPSTLGLDETVNIYR